jgi:hypothetical protein
MATPRYQNVRITSGNQIAEIIVGEDYVHIKPEDLGLMKSLFGDLRIAHVLRKGNRQFDDGYFLFRYTGKGEDVQRKVKNLGAAIEELSKEQSLSQLAGYEEHISPEKIIGSMKIPKKRRYH